MTDFIVGAILVILVGAAIGYIVKEKKRGVKCIGCPAASTCASCKHPEGGSCSCGIEASESEILEAVRSCHTEEK